MYTDKQIFCLGEGGGVKEVGEREGSTSYQEVILCMQVNTK